MFCKHCGKEIKDGVRFCPMCGKPTGVTEEKEKLQSTNDYFQNKKPNPKVIFAILGVVVLVFLIGGIGKKISSLNNDTQNAFKDNTAESDIAESSNTENSGESQNDYEDKKWTKTKSYKRAYEEEYNSFDARLEDFCEQKAIEYVEMADKVADGFNEAYKELEKEVPNISSYIGLDAGIAVSDSFTGVEIVSTLTQKAVSNEKVRKIGFKAMTYAGAALLDYAMNYTTTDYPFGFSVLALNGDYALLRSNGTYEDMQKIIGNNMSYDTKVAMLQTRIDELEDNALDVENKDEYAEYMGRIAANKDREKEINDLYNKCMVTIACSGNGYWLADSIKLYWLVGKDDTIYNSFWAPARTGAENASFEISLCENGSCLLEKESTFLENDELKRFVLDKTGEIIFEGVTFEELEEAPVDESIIYSYGPSGNALRATKVKDSTYGTYYVIELVNKKGKAKKLLEARKIGEPSCEGHYVGGSANEVLWNDYMTCSDYTLLNYEPLENQGGKNVVDLSTGKIYAKEEIEESIMAGVLEEKEENQKLAQSGTLKDGWLWNAQNGDIFVQNTSSFLENGLGHNFLPTYAELQEADANFYFNAEALLKNIGESREISGCYCKDDRLWIVTRSGYFYTYDLEKKKKSSEVEVGEGAPYSFTPYGLMVYGKNEKGSAKVEYESNSEQETEYSVYQYDASGKRIAKYPVYSDTIYDLNGYIFDFLYCSGKDTYNLVTQEIFSM